MDAATSRRGRILAPLAVGTLVVLVAGCVGPRPAYDPGITPGEFVAGVDHPFYPLRPGAYWVYELREGPDVERIEVRVLNETRDVNGVAATVVRDTVTVNGVLVEDTWDWFGEDRRGNVWYLGEDTAEYENGEVVSRAGAWEWGVDGAMPGIIMWAEPVANGTPYFQEFYWGEAVDEAAVIDIGRRVETPAGSFTDTVTTREWTRLDKGVEEEAHYARGVGVVVKEQTKGDERGTREVLVDYEVPAR